MVLTTAPAGIEAPSAAARASSIEAKQIRGLPEDEPVLRRAAGRAREPERCALGAGVGLLATAAAAASGT